jgi:hypothetical protein
MYPKEIYFFGRISILDRVIQAAYPTPKSRTRVETVKIGRNLSKAISGLTINCSILTPFENIFFAYEIMTRYGDKTIDFYQ